MLSAGSTTTDGGGRAWGFRLWSVPVVGLVAFWLWLAFSSGGYIASHWLPASLALGLFGLVVSLLGAYPRRPGQLSLAVLAVFGAYGVWVTFSAVWAQSPTRAWMESARTFTYVLVFALALVYFTDATARRALRYLVVAASLLVLLVCIIKLWTTNSVTSLFDEGRFAYPTSASNQAGTLFLVGFWPLMWLASAPEERSPVRGVALGVATGLLGLTVMTQSRGAIWSLALTLLLMFAISPRRLRLLFYLVVPVLLMVYAFPTLDQYWTKGPEAVGGAAGARTLLVATAIAGFIGMILALLERWVSVTRKMKAIFGTIIIVAVIGGGLYWVITSTSDVGGPFKWVSQTWEKFTTNKEPPTSEQSSRFALVTSTGRVQIWRAAIQEYESAPLLGVGADNFVFDYYRLRTLESQKPQQAHSLELQALSETGSVGGALLCGGVLLALLGLLWPRCTAGWRGARATWLRGRDAKAGGVSRASPRWCNSRWGDDAGVYGWEMALLAGAAFWLVHASIDWIWQMAGVTIPALLFLAAALAGVDGRAGVLWPRLQRWLRIGAPADAAEPLQTAELPGQVPRVHSQGLLLQVFRALVVALSAVLLLLAGLPYLSIQFQNSALALAKSDPSAAVKRVEAAPWLVPTDPAPYVTKAIIYEKAAAQALKSGGSAAAGAVLDDLSLAIASYEEAISQEPADWTSHYQAGLATLNLALATGYIQGWDTVTALGGDVTPVGGVADWSALAGASKDVASPGLTPGSLAEDDTTRAAVARFRRLSQEQSADLALDFISEAKERNPLAEQIGGAMALANKIRGD